MAYPTEAVFGLGCDPANAEALARLVALKRRDAAKGLLLIAADFQQLKTYLARPAPEVMERVAATWPGFVTWVLPARRGLSRWLTGRHAGLAVRVTAQPLAGALCRAFGGALVSTSANVAGRPPARDARAVRRLFGRRVDLILPGAVDGEARPSPIRDALSGRVIRE